MARLYMIELIGGDRDREIHEISEATMRKGEFEIYGYGPPLIAVATGEEVPMIVRDPRIHIYVRSSDKRYWIHKTTG